MKYLVTAMALTAAFLFTTTTGETGGKDKEKGKFVCKCPVSGKPASKDFAVDFNGGKVYFCCPKCPGAFGKKTKKFAAKANHQMVGTEQAVLKKCPFTGKSLNPATKISVQGVNVCFCCFKCQGKAKKAEGKAQVELIFNQKAFKKGFEVKKGE